jgi:hypothetical protein
MDIKSLKGWKYTLLNYYTPGILKFLTLLIHLQNIIQIINIPLFFQFLPFNTQLEYF